MYTRQIRSFSIILIPLLSLWQKGHTQVPAYPSADSNHTSNFNQTGGSRLETHARSHTSADYRLAYPDLSPLHQDRNLYNPTSFAISGNYAIFGTAQERMPRPEYSTTCTPDFKHTNAGAAYMMERDSTGSWQVIQKLYPPVRRVQDYFGHAVAISGNWAMIGGLTDDSDTVYTPGTLFTGAIYFYEREASGTWVFRQRIQTKVGLNAMSNVQNLDLDGNTAVVGLGNCGSPNWEDCVTNVGRITFFEKDAGGTWRETQTDIPNDLPDLSHFGFSAKVQGEYAIVGAPFLYLNAKKFEPRWGESHGAVFIYKRNKSGKWERMQRLTAPDPKAYAHFGWSIDIDQGYATVGAMGKYEVPNAKVRTPRKKAVKRNHNRHPGAVFLYKLDESGYWNFHEKFSPGTEAPRNLFGYMVSLKNKLAVVGASGLYSLKPNKSFNPRKCISPAGSVYCYGEDENGKWKLMHQLYAPDSLPWDGFGWGVHTDGSRIITIGKLPEKGRTYIQPPNINFKGKSYSHLYIFERCPDPIHKALTVTGNRRYTYPGTDHTWTESGIYEFRIDHPYLCDTLVHLNLTIAKHDSLDTNQSQFPNAKTASGSGEGTNRPQASKLNLEAYPNPTTRDLTLDLGEEPQSGKLILYDPKGKFMATQPFQNSNSIPLSLKGPAGLYLIEIRLQNGQTAYIKVTKQ